MKLIKNIKFRRVIASVLVLMLLLVEVINCLETSGVHVFAFDQLDGKGGSYEEKKDPDEVNTALETNFEQNGVTFKLSLLRQKGFEDEQTLKIEDLSDKGEEIDKEITDNGITVENHAFDIGVHIANKDGNNIERDDASVVSGASIRIEAIENESNNEKIDFNTYKLLAYDSNDISNTLDEIKVDISDDGHNYIQFNIDELKSYSLVKVNYNEKVTDSDNMYLILYSNGDLVYQLGDTEDVTKGNIEYKAPYDMNDDYKCLKDVFGEEKLGTIKRVIFADKYKATNLAQEFRDMTGLEEIIGLENLDTSNLTSLWYTFYRCYSLKTLNIGILDLSNLNNMYATFDDCPVINHLDFGDNTLNKVTTAEFAFWGCLELDDLKMDNVTFSNIKSLSGIFDRCPKLYNFSTSRWNGQNVTNLTYAFMDCNTRVIDLSNINVASNTGVNYAFSGNWTTLKLSDSIAKIVKDTSFNGDNKRVYLDSNFNKYTKSEMVSAFNNLSVPDNTMYLQKDLTFYYVVMPGGSTVSASDNQTFTYDETVETPNFDGHSFDGWYTEPDGGTRLENGDKLTADAYYAHWDTSRYTLELKSNENGVDTTKSVQLRYDESYTLSKETFTREGYVLTGFNTLRDGSGTAYKLGGQVSGLTDKDGGNVVLYAQWRKTDDFTTVTFDTGCDWGISNVYVPLGESIKSYVSDIKRTGYIFEGWHIGSVDGTLLTDDYTTNKKTLTLVAGWIKDLTVTFDTRGIGDNIVRTVPYNTKLVWLPSVRDTKDDAHRIAGWFTDVDAGEKITEDTRITEDVTFYAHWGYAPDFILNGGTYIDNFEPTVQDDIQYTVDKLPDVEKPGFEFVKWTLEDNTTEVKAGDKINLFNHRQIVAQWRKKVTLTVKLYIPTWNESSKTSDWNDKDVVPKTDSNGVTEFSLYDTLYLDTNTVIGLPDFSNEIHGAYTFDCWSKTKDGFGQSKVSDSNTVKNGTTVNDSVIELYANYMLGNVTFAQFIPQDLDDTQAVGTWKDGVDDDRYVKYIKNNDGTYTIYGRAPEIKAPDNYKFIGFYSTDNKSQVYKTGAQVNKCSSYYAKFELINKVKTATSKYGDFTYSYDIHWESAGDSGVTISGNNIVIKQKSGLDSRCKLHLNFEINSVLSGESIEANKLHMYIPISLIKDKYGNNAAYVTMSNYIGYEHSIKNMSFAYTETTADLYGDGQQIPVYDIYNIESIRGGAGVSLDLEYTIQTAYIYGGYMDKDGNIDESAGYTSVSIPVRFGDYTRGITDASSDLSIEVHKQVNDSMKLIYDSGSFYGKWISSWGDQPSDSKLYAYVVWKISLYNGGCNSTIHSFTATPKQDGILVGFSDDERGTMRKNTTFRSESNKNTIIYMLVKYKKSELENTAQGGLQVTASIIDNIKTLDDYTYKLTDETIAFLNPGDLKNDEFNMEYNGENQFSNKQTEYLHKDAQPELNWKSTYAGSGVEDGIQWDNSTGTYSRETRTITVHDDGIYYTSGTYNYDYWITPFGNKRLDDDAYTITKLKIGITEYDNTYSNNQWLNKTEVKNKDAYGTIEVYLRQSGDTDYKYYKTIKIENDGLDNDGLISVDLPASVAGYKVVHETNYWYTTLNCYSTYKLLKNDNLYKYMIEDERYGYASVFRAADACEVSSKSVFEQFSVKNGLANKLNIRLTSGNKRFIASSSHKNAEYDMEERTSTITCYAAGYRQITWSSLPGNMTNGTTYCLLPANTTISNIHGYKILDSNKGAQDFSCMMPSASYEISYVNNWENSNKTMMIIKWTLASSDNAAGATFEFDLTRTMEDVKLYGTDANLTIATVNNAGTGKDACSGSLESIKNGDAGYFESLDAQYKSNIAFSATQMQFNNFQSSSWGYQTFVNTGRGNKIHEYNGLNSEYSYKLQYKQSDLAEVSKMVFYDVLEADSRSKWNGTFDSVDTSTLETVHNGSSSDTCKPVIYYSTKNRKDFTDDDFDITNSTIWTTDKPSDSSKITAVAVDCRYDTSGNEMVFSGLQALEIGINMITPASTSANENLFGKTAYNRSVISTLKVGDTKSTTMDSTARITLHEPELEIHKSSDPDTGTEDDPAEVITDTQLVYYLSITNKDGDASDGIESKNIIVEDSIPDGLEIDKQNIGVNFGDVDTFTQVGLSPRVSLSTSDQKLKFTIGSLSAGETLKIKIPTKVNTYDTVLKNQASIVSVDSRAKDIKSETTYHSAKKYDKYKLTLSKTNVLGEKLGGAVLRLTGKSYYSSDPIEAIEFTTVADEDKEYTLYTGDYTLTELSAPDGYVVADPIKIRLTKDMTVTMVDSKPVSLKVSKTWNDGDMSTRPKTVDIDLLKNGKVFDTVSLSWATGWEYELTGLVRTDTSGNEIDYSVKEHTVSGYNTYISKTSEDKKDGSRADTVQIKNVLNETISGTKEWEGDTTTTRPESVEVKLIRNNEVADTCEVKDTNSWKFKFSNLDVYDEDGIPYEYSVQEGYTEGYKSEITRNEDRTYTIKNTKLSDKATTVEIAKVDKQGGAVTGAVMQLLDNHGQVVKEWVTDSETEKFDGLDPGKYTIHEEEAPAGYSLAPDEEIDIEDKTDLQTFYMVDLRVFSLTIKNTISGNGADSNKEFKFSMTLNGLSTIEYHKTLQDKMSDSGTLNATDGKFTFTLKANESIEFPEIEQGIRYVVMEEDSDGYEVTTVDNVGVLEDSDMVTVFDNHKELSFNLPQAGSWALLILTLLTLAFGGLSVVLRKSDKSK